MKKLLFIAFVLFCTIPVYAQPVLPPIVITEIMQNPDELRDTEGEWFEIYNAGSFHVNLSGWTIVDDKTDSHVISPFNPLFIAPGQVLVFCQNANETENGDFSCDYVYKSVILDNNADELVLRNVEGQEVDRVAYDGGPGFPSPLGASMFFKGHWTDDNNDGSLWEASFERLPNYENDDCPTCMDYGSPGQVDLSTLLPVELVSFGVTVDGDRAILKWETATELNNAGFQIEYRQADGTFSAAGWVNGAGTTNDARSYTFSVDRLAHGAHVFRLKQVDFDGAYAYSDEVAATIQVEVSYVKKPYPNPFNPETSIVFGVARDQQVLVEVVDMLGRRVKLAFEGWATANEPHQLRISGAGLPSGRYMIRVAGESFQETHSIYLVK